jgi:hypothetical protein
VLSGFNADTGNVEFRVANDPMQILGAPPRSCCATRRPERTRSRPAAPWWVHRSGLTLDNLPILVSQWNNDVNMPDMNTLFDTQMFLANVHPPP